MLLRISVFAALGGFLFGYDLGLIGGALLGISQQLNIQSTLTKEWVVGALKLGAFFGTFLGGALMLRYGRKRAIAATAITGVLGPLVMALASGPAGLIAGRVLCGLGIGASAIVAPAYLAEVAPAAQRGAVVQVYEVMLCAGTLCSVVVDWGLSKLWGPGAWRAMVALPALPGAAIGLALVLLPESPRWLVMRGRLDEALSVLQVVTRGASAVLPRKATPTQRARFEAACLAGAEDELLALWSAVEKDKAAVAERRLALLAARQARARARGTMGSSGGGSGMGSGGGGEGRSSGGFGLLSLVARAGAGGSSGAAGKADAVGASIGSKGSAAAAASSSGRKGLFSKSAGKSAGAAGDEEEGEGDREPLLPLSTVSVSSVWGSGGGAGPNQSGPAGTSQSAAGTYQEGSYSSEGEEEGDWEEEEELAGNAGLRGPSDISLTHQRQHPLLVPAETAAVGADSESDRPLGLLVSSHQNLHHRSVKGLHQEAHHTGASAAAGGGGRGDASGPPDSMEEEEGPGSGPLEVHHPLLSNHQHAASHGHGLQPLWSAASGAGTLGGGSAGSLGTAASTGGLFGKKATKHKVSRKQREREARRKAHEVARAQAAAAAHAQQAEQAAEEEDGDEEEGGAGSRERVPLMVSYGAAEASAGGAAPGQQAAGTGHGGAQAQDAAVVHPMPGEESHFGATIWGMLQDVYAVARGDEGRAFRVACVLAFLNQATASTAVINFAPTLLKQLAEANARHAAGGAGDSGAPGGGGLSDGQAMALTAAVALTKVFGVCIGLLTVDSLGRRPLLGWGAVGCGAAMAGAAAAAAARSAAGVLACLCAFIFSFSVSWAGVFWVVVAECFSMSAKSPAASAATALLFLTGSATNLVFLSLAEAMGAASFLVFGAVALGAAVFVWACVPETKGRTLAEVQAIMNRGGWAWRTPPTTAAGPLSGGGATPRS